MGGGNTLRIIGVYFLVTSSLCFTYGYITTNPDGATVIHRTTRSTTECFDKYRDITSGHTACIERSSIVQASGLVEGDQQLIIDMHNTARKEVTPSARNMQLMTWDAEIALIAQRWADHCVTDHDKGYQRYDFGRFAVGQNLAWGNRLTWAGALELWINERNDFNYGGIATGVIGHYTQMVWAETSKIGCGYATCGNKHYYVCNYAPGGNSNPKNLPYLTGPACGDCPKRCTNGLCDCGGRVCYNGGTLDLVTCTCTCKKNLQFFIQPDCALNCTDITDPWYCANWEGKCEIFSNVPQECPKLCNWCPTAGKGYNEDSSSAPVTSPMSFVTLLLILCMCLFSLFQYRPLE